jgi:Tfp pilus assembly protein PilF
MRAWSNQFFFMLFCVCAGVQAADTEITFNRDIAPIVFDNCTLCHRPGESGPFDLVTYHDVRKRARQIVRVTESRYMPPWLPETNGVDFVDVRRLTDEQIGAIRQWVEQGTVEGDPADLPPLPQWTEGWQLGQPDVIITMPEAYSVRADGPDIWRNFVIPIPVSEPKFVRAFEFRPGNAKILHHARMLFDTSGRCREKAEADPEPGLEGMILGAAENPAGQWLGWTPGKQPVMGPEEISWQLEPGTDLVLEMHMLPSGKPEQIRPSLGLHFSSRPPKHIPTTLRLGPKIIDIEPGDENHIIRDSYMLPIDVSLVKVYPHAHLLCREMKGWAELPDGSLRSLLHIRAWDFDWQDEYRYAESIPLPKGTKLYMEYAYDNSAGNVRNPNDPPRRIAYSESTSGEMGDLWFQVIPVNGQERMILESDSSIHEVNLYMDATRARLAADPDVPGAHRSLAYFHSKLGEFDDAVRHMTIHLDSKSGDGGGHLAAGTWLHELQRHGEALQHLRKALILEPGQVDVHYAMGLTLAAARKPAEAVTEFRKALELNPDYTDARIDLGVMFASSGRLADAEKQFLEAVERAPESSRAHLNLGMVLAQRGDLENAEKHFRRSVEIGSATTADGLAAAQFAIGSILLQGGKPEEAVEHLREAIALRPDHAKTQATLGLTLAANGDTEAGLRYFRRALQQRYAVPSQLNDMAWSLSTHPKVDARRPAAAIEFAEGAVAMTNRREPGFLDTLAVAYAAAGRFDEAVITADEALALAPPDLAKEIRGHVELFRKGKTLEPR